MKDIACMLSLVRLVETHTFVGIHGLALQVIYFAVGVVGSVDSQGRGGSSNHNAVLRFLTINVTSLGAHWRTVCQAQSDFVLVCETRSTQSEQRTIELGMKAAGWNVLWSDPIMQGHRKDLVGLP